MCIDLRQRSRVLLRGDRRRLTWRSRLRNLRSLASSLNLQLIGAGRVAAEAGHIDLRHAIFREDYIEARVVAAAAIIVVVRRKRAGAAHIEVGVERFGRERDRIALTLTPVQLIDISDRTTLIGLGFARFQRARDLLAGLEAAAGHLAASRQGGGQNN